jgi:hypothetical protein
MESYHPRMLATVLQAVLPLISLLSGILSLYIDAQKEPKKKWLLVVVLLLSAFATIGLNVHDDQMHASEAEALKNALAKVQKSSDDTHSDVRILLEDVAIGFGYSSDAIAQLSSEDSLIKHLTASASADEHRTALLAAKLPSPKIHPTVIYYAKPEEAEGVKKALMEVPILDVSVKAPLDPNPSNVIWIGDSITPPVAQYVAQTLLRAGVKLNKIFRFHDGSGAKANLIEVGAYEKYRSASSLSAEEISAMSEFPRDPLPARNTEQ